MTSNTWYTVARTTDSECIGRVSFSIGSSALVFDVLVQYGNISISIVSAVVVPDTVFSMRVRTSGPYRYVDIRTSVTDGSTPSFSVSQVLNTLSVTSFEEAGTGTQECIITTDAWAPGSPADEYVTIGNIETITALKYFTDGVAIGDRDHYHTLVYGNDGVYLGGYRVLTANDGAGYVTTGSYNSTTKKIELKHGSTVLAEIDATDFIKDGMVDSVTVEDGYLVITFNADSGKEPISVELSDFFDADDYYDKSDIDTLLAGYLPLTGGTITGNLKVNGVTELVSALIIPASAPSSPVSGKTYIYAGSGSYGEEPSGGVSEVYTLTLKKGATTLGTYDPDGGENQTIDISNAFSGYATQTWVTTQIGNIDLTGYVPTTRKVNGKALSSDITLGLSDVATKSDIKTMLGDDSYVAYVAGPLTAWGQTYWNNGAPQSISGSLTSVTDITGSGKITIPKGKFASLLMIPSSAPSSGDVVSGETYIYSGTGNYGEEASGGISDVSTLTITINGSTTVYDPAGDDASVSFGSASQKAYTGTIESNGTGLPTAGAVYTYVNNSILAAQPYKGVSSTAITDGGTEMPTITGYTTRTHGDVVAYDKKEFIWDTNDKWRLLGDEGSYALKTTSVIAGTGLSGGGQISQDVTLNLSSATITSLGKADTAYQKPSGGIPASDLADAYLKLSGNSVATKITGDVYMTRGKYLKMVETNGTDSVNLLGISSSGAWFTLGNGSYRAEISSNNSDILHIKSGVSYAVYDESNLTKSVLTTLLESSNGYYVKKSGDTMTGTLNAQSVIPTSNTLYDLGSNNYKWNGVYARGVYTAIAKVDGLLAIPTAAPQSGSIVSGEYYLYANTSGNYSESAGGGVSDVYPLTLTINGTSTVYNPGTAAQTISFLAPTSAQITAWNAKYDKPSGGIPKTDLASAVQTSLGKADSALQSVAFSDLTTHPTTISGYGITDAKIETPSGTSNRKITLGSNSFTIYAWALASSKPSYTLDDVADGSTRKLANYLPLAGGTMTGDIILTNGKFIRESSGNNAILGINSGSFIAGSPAHPAIIRTDGTAITRRTPSANYTVYDSGNLALSTLVGSTSAIGASNRPVYYNGSTLAACTVGDAYLSWGGADLNGNFSPIDASMVGLLGANRLAFMPADGITVQYSRDGGSTWTDYGADNGSKINFFNEIMTAYQIGKASSSSPATVNYQLRVRITTPTINVYTVLNKFVVYVTTYGSGACWCTIKGRTVTNHDNNVDTWTTFKEKAPIAGWSGYNVINTSGITVGNGASQIRDLDFIFGCDNVDSVSSTYSGLIVRCVLGFGGVGWNTPSYMASSNRLYTYDYNQAMYLPQSLYPVSHDDSKHQIGSTSRLWYAAYVHYVCTNNINARTSNAVTVTTSSTNSLAINDTSSSINNYIMFQKSGTNKVAVGYFSNFAFISNETTTASYSRIGVTDTGVPQYWTSGDNVKKTLIHEGNTSLIHAVNDATTYNPSTSSFQSGRTAWAAAIDSHALGVGSRTGYKEDGTNYLSGAMVFGQAITVNGSTVYGGVISPAGSVTFTYSGTSYTVNNPSSSYYRTFVVVKGTNMITPNTSSWSASSGRGWWVWANGFYYVASGCGAFLQCGDAYCVVSADNVSSTTATAAKWTSSQVYVRVPINSSSSYQDGMYAFAEGIYSVANTRAGVAMGYSAFSTGLSSTAIGTYPMALGNYSTALGYLAVASGIGSTALGYQVWASGNYSTAIGLSTVAATSYQTVIGKYNLWNSSDAFQIGWGSGDNDRKNILTLGQIGNLTLADGGNLVVGSQGGGAANIANYISAGRSYGTGAGRYGVKVLTCDQSNCQSGLGQDLACKSGWSNNYNHCMVACHDAHSKISFVTHQVNSTTYTYLGGFQYTASGTKIEFNVNGKSYLPEVEVDTSLAVPTAAPSSPTSGKVYMWIGSTGSYVN